MNKFSKYAENNWYKVPLRALEEVFCLEIIVKDSSKIVEIWLSNSEKDNMAVHNSLKPVYAVYKAKKYKVAVFQSGNGDLLGNTKDLLLHNRRA